MSGPQGSFEPAQRAPQPILRADDRALARRAADEWPTFRRPSAPGDCPAA
ncbi:MAG TPA: hypothetical protein VHF51_11175 [Solirubrobacteraceae bacterium]|nr:hypothetical protein [Solirubrobacteraceae bacterium]